MTHHVALSVVGTEELATQSGYFDAKLLQERLIAGGPIPYTIVHATQFFEFLGTLADSATVDGSVRMPPAYFQPMAATDVAEGVANAAVHAPVGGTVEIGGPAAVLLPDLLRTHTQGTHQIIRHHCGAVLEDIRPRHRRAPSTSTTCAWAL